jgi:hypothetical protein
MRAASGLNLGIVYAKLEAPNIQIPPILRRVLQPERRCAWLVVKDAPTPGRLLLNVLFHYQDRERRPPQEMMQHARGQKTGSAVNPGHLIGDILAQ